MAIRRLVDNQRGIALITVMLVALAVSSVAIAATMMSLSGTLVRRYSERTTIADHAALSGVQEGLSAVLGNDSLYPTSGFTTLEDSVQVRDASGSVIPGVWRSTYVGPSADPSIGSVVSEVWGLGRVRAVRRLEIVAKSFASYGTFVNDNSGGPAFAPSHDQHGPVHFNSDFAVAAPAAGDTAIFYGEVTTTGNVSNSSNGLFRQGFTENTTTIALPALDLGGLDALATTAGLRYTSTTAGPTSAPVRLEFIAVDMDGDSLTTGDIEGFVRVYSNLSHREYTVAWETGGSILTTPNCGVPDAGGIFRRYLAPYSLPVAEQKVDANEYRCYLGGDPALDGLPGFTATDTLGGQWLAWGGAVVPGLQERRQAAVGTAPGAVGYDDSPYLHPYTPGVNSNATGVIYVDGDIGVSGVVAGKVTVVSADDIIILDDIVQYHDPSLAACDRDLLGLIAVDDIVLADNTLNTPQRYGGGGIGDEYHTMSATKDEFVHAVMMAYSEFLVDNALFGPTYTDNSGLGAEPCEGIPWGRGCLYLTGGLIMDDRGQIGSGGTGHWLRQSYNACVRQGAPPHFPTTGTFNKRRTFEIDGANFDAATWFANYQS